MVEGGLSTRGSLCDAGGLKNGSIGHGLGSLGFGEQCLGGGKGLLLDCIDRFAHGGDEGDQSRRCVPHRRVTLLPLEFGLQQYRMTQFT